MSSEEKIKKTVRITTESTVKIYTDVEVLVDKSTPDSSIGYAIRNYVKAAMGAGIELPWKCDFVLSSDEIDALATRPDHRFSAAALDTEKETF